MNCHYCKKSFKLWKNTQKYCSQKCYWFAKVGSMREKKKRQECVCASCGKNFWRYKSHLKRVAKGRYCSMKCLGVANKKSLSGSGHWNWKGGISPRSLNTVEYKEWRRKVFERDNYICVECGYAGGRILQADHIKSWKDFPKLRFIVSNGRTLCKPCHMKTPTWGYH